MVTHIIRAGSRRVAIAAIVMASASCGTLTRQGTSFSYLIVNELVAASGAEPGTFGATLYSDVQTVVADVPTIFSDLGRIRLSLALKDPGPSTGPTIPSTNNFVTLTQYHVGYTRADGRNTPGVDVPYAFDGAITATVTAEITQSFELVRHIAKKEAPLAALARNGVIIGSIAEVTFYGHDQTGRQVVATGKILVEFGNFGDPQ